MQANNFSTKIVLALLVISAVIATLVPYAWARWNTGSEWRGVTPELSYDAMFYYARANDVTRGHFFVTNPFYFEHRNEPAAIPSADDAIIALPQLLGFSFNVGYYANIFLWSLLLLFLFYILFRALGLSLPVSLLGTLWCYVGVYGGMLRPGSMQIIFPLYALFLFYFWRYLNDKERSAPRSEDVRPSSVEAPAKGVDLLRGIFPLAIIMGVAPYFYIHLFMTIGATLGLYALALLYWRRWGDVRRIFLMGIVALTIVIPHALHGFSLATRPFYWDAMLHNAFLYSHWPQIEAYYYGRWVVLVLLLVYMLRRYSPDTVSRATHSFISLTGFGILLAMVSNIFTGRDFEIAVHVARFSIFWYLMVGVMLFRPVYMYVFHPPARAVTAGGFDFGRAGIRGAWLKRGIVGTLVALLLLQMVINIGRSVPHFSLMREQFIEAQSYRGVIEWLKQQPEGVVVAPEDLNSYIPTLTKQYVLYHTYGAHFAVSDDENQERFLIYRAFDQLTESEFIKQSIGYYGPVPSYLAKTSALRYRLCTLLRLREHCPAPEDEQSFRDSAAMQKKFEAYYPSLVANIAQEYAKYHVRYVISKIGDIKMSGKLPACALAYHDQWFDVCKVDAL